MGGHLETEIVQYGLLPGFLIREKNRDCSVWPFTKLTIRIIDLAAGMQSLEHLSQLQLRLRLRVKWQYGSGSGSHSGQNMTAPAAPAPLRLCVPVHYGNIYLSWGILGLGRITRSVLTFLAVSYLQEPKIKILIKKMNLTV